MKVTKPVGGIDAVVLWNVAVSLTVIGVPTMVDDGTACVMIDGDTGLTVMDSFGSLQPVVNRLLFASPGYEAIQ